MSIPSENGHRADLNMHNMGERGSMYARCRGDKPKVERGKQHKKSCTVYVT